MITLRAFEIWLYHAMVAEKRQRSKGLADNAAKKGNSFSTPDTKTSMVNVSKTSLIPNYFQKAIYFLSNIQC